MPLPKAALFLFATALLFAVACGGGNESSEPTSGDTGSDDTEQPEPDDEASDGDDENAGNTSSATGGLQLPASTEGNECSFISADRVGEIIGRSGLQASPTPGLFLCAYSESGDASGAEGVSIRVAEWTENLNAETERVRAEERGEEIESLGYSDRSYLMTGSNVFPATTLVVDIDDLFVSVSIRDRESEDGLFQEEAMEIVEEVLNIDG